MVFAGSDGTFTTHRRDGLHRLVDLDQRTIHELERHLRYKDCMQVRGYPDIDLGMILSPTEFLIKGFRSSRFAAATRCRQR